MNWPRYLCPMCGVANASDGNSFCGKCEEKHQKSEELLREMEAEERARLLERLHR